MTPASQSMKPATAAKKLDVYLPATPTEFQDGMVTRAELAEMQQNPPDWLTTLRKDGPHPRGEVARRLGISTSGLARAQVGDAMTTEEIRALLDEQPEWLRQERETQAGVRREKARLASRDADRAQAGKKKG